jgi:hypothetical protein
MAADHPQGDTSGARETTEETKGIEGDKKVFLNDRLTTLSDILRTWRSGPQGSLEKILRFFQKGG